MGFDETLWDLNGFDGSENWDYFLEIHNCWEYPQILYIYRNAKRLLK